MAYGAKEDIKPKAVRCIKENEVLQKLEGYKMNTFSGDIVDGSVSVVETWDNGNNSIFLQYYSDDGHNPYNTINRKLLSFNGWNYFYRRHYLPAKNINPNGTTILLIPTECFDYTYTGNK